MVYENEAAETSIFYRPKLIINLIFKPECTIYLESGKMPKPHYTIKIETFWLTPFLFILWDGS